MSSRHWKHSFCLAEHVVSLVTSLRIPASHNTVNHNSRSLPSAIEFRINPDSIWELYQTCTLTKTLTALAASRSGVICRFYQRKLIPYKQQSKLGVSAQHQHTSSHILSNPDLTRVSEQGSDLNKVKSKKHLGFFGASKAGLNQTKRLIETN